MKFTTNTIGIWVAAALAIMAGTSYGAPAIVSVTQNGGSLTVQGSGFGNHANYGQGQPFLSRAWNDFSSGSVDGGNLARDGTPDAAANWSIQSAGARPNHAFWLRRGAVSSRLGWYGVGPTSGQHQWFTSFWFKYHNTASTDGGKFWRIWENNNNNIWLATGGGDTSVRGAFENPGADTVFGSPNSFGENTWHRVDIWMNDGTIGGAKEFTVYMDNIQQWTKPTWGDTPFDWGGGWEIGQMIEVSGNYYGFSDVYYDHTRARVEIGNAPTWSSSTIREIQIPKSWSDTGISAQLNKGALSNGANAYVFVVDESGNVSNGYPITIGTPSASPSAVAPPQNLHVL